MGLLAILLFQVFISSTQGCVDNAIVLPNLERRARNQQGTTPYISDFYLDNKWYSVRKTNLQYRMPDETTQPEFLKCGTFEPVYLKGKHPAIETLTEIPTSSIACLKDTFSDCKIEYPIEIRKCGTEIQYKLVYTKANSAYCFDPPNIQGVNSSDFQPMPTDVDLGTVEVEPRLNFQTLVNGQFTNYKPYVSFFCTFNYEPVPEYYYRVFWMVNDNVVASKMTKSYSELYIDEGDFLKQNIPLGINIRCGVLVSTHPDGEPTPMKSSDNYYAGIKILEPIVYLPKTESAYVNFSLTVPIGCGYSNMHTDLPSYCQVALRMYDPNGHKCGTANIVTISNNRLCGTSFKALTKGDAWNKNNLEVYTFPVQTVDEDTTDPQSYSLHLQMDTVMEHEWWKGLLAPTVAVHVDGSKDHTLRNSYCYAHVDPHMRTSDKYLFESQNPGRYIMYHNHKYRIEVQYETTYCNSNRAQCVCAVAIRAGGDVFKIDLCSKHRLIGFVSCTDNGILKVVRKTSQRYQVYTPIGTWIDLNLLNKRYMNVDIKMSAKDFKNTKGLCGYFDGNRNNDLLLRDGSHETILNRLPLRERQHRVFNANWRVNPEKYGDFDLLEYFSPTSLPRWQDYNGLFCVCNKATIDWTVKKESTAVCSGTQYIDCIVHSGFPYRNCKITKRKRNLSYEKEERELERYLKKISGHKRRATNTYTRLVREVTNNVSESDATDHCTAAINSSVAVTKYEESLAGEDPNSVIEQCVFDVLEGNDLSLSIPHVDALNLIVDKVFEKDPIYVANNTEKVDFFIANTCPSNCSNSGKCSQNGTCECNVYKHGPDCSIDERDLLQINDMEGDGLCNITDGDGCDCFLIRTEVLLPQFQCQISGNMTYIDGTSEDINVTTTDGEYGDMFSAICCAPVRQSSKRSLGTPQVFVTRYDIALSNDGKSFGDSAPIFIFDSACQTPVVKTDGSYIFFLKDRTCFINGECALKNKPSDTDPCLTCVPETNQYNWTNSCSPVADSKKSDLGIILGATLGSIFACVIVAGIFILWKFSFGPKMKKHKSVGDSTLFSDTVVVNNQ